MKLLYLRNKKFIFFIFFNLSFLGLLISNIFNFNLNDYKKINKSLETANKKC